MYLASRNWVRPGTRRTLHSRRGGHGCWCGGGVGGGGTGVSRRGCSKRMETATSASFGFRTCPLQKKTIVLEIKTSICNYGFTNVFPLGRSRRRGRLCNLKN